MNAMYLEYQIFPIDIENTIMNEMKLLRDFLV